MSAASDEVFDKITALAQAVPTITDAQVEAVMDAIWPEIAMLVYHYEVVLANAAVRLGSLSQELHSQIIGVPRP